MLEAFWGSQLLQILLVYTPKYFGYCDTAGTADARRRVGEYCQ